MDFNALDARMRVFETAADTCVLPGIYMVARIDGRSFSHLTRDVLRSKEPFHLPLRDAMVAASRAVMDCGFRAVYAHTQSDEISVLLHRDETLFGRKLRKYNSILAGEVSATFSMELGIKGVFDCRICQLPAIENVLDYFRWRQEDAHRNALNAHCYWALRNRGQSPADATARLKGLSTGDKNQFLFEVLGQNYNDLPRWQRRGTGFYWEPYEKPGVNPKTGDATVALRQRLKTDSELPMKEEYASLLRSLIERSEAR
ncbi:MAG: tRNA(His) guanylyltransferase Thg1 family protein [Planctomycetota bacterium]